MTDVYKQEHGYDDSLAKIRVSAPSDLQAGYTFEAHYSIGPEIVSFEVTVVSIFLLRFCCNCKFD